MSSLSVTSDPVALTLTAVGQYPVPVERLWAAWADPRQLERFWGPPTWPATFHRHDMRPGGRSMYEMTGPSGEKVGGYMLFETVHAPEELVAYEGFTDADGEPDDTLPKTQLRVVFSRTADGSTFQAVSTYASVEAMETMMQMGVLDGMREALGQLASVLADLKDVTSAFTAALEVLDDTRVCVTRDIRGPIDLVWRAHHEPALITQWMLGPPGWTMPVCDVARKVGDTYRYERENAEDGARFGFVGELLSSDPPRHEVSTECMIGMEGPGAQNELTLTPLAGGHTRMSLVITYPSKEVRDMVLQTGMVDGMEASYAALDAVLAQGV